jgi:type II secretory pathway component PulF
MNLPQLALFSEGLARMLANGIAMGRALSVAGNCMAARENRRFAERLGPALLEGEDLSAEDFPGSLPPFYLTIVQCGILTGRISQALDAAAYYVRQVLPVRHTLRRCGRYAMLAYLVCIVITWIFQRRPSFAALLILAALYLLPRFVEALAEVRDAIVANLPFTGTWARQVALLEFFSCMDICYDSTLAVPEMFEASTRAVGNRYLRRDLFRARTLVERGNSFADALGAVPFIPRGMIADIQVNELCGKLELSFHGFARELRKVIEAKLEPIKALSTAAVLSYGVLTPLAIVLPIFIAAEWLGLYFLLMGGYVWLVSTYMAFTNYMRKAAEVNCWWDNLHPEESRPV